MRNKRGEVSVLGFLVWGTLIIIAAVVIGFVFIHTGIGKTIGGYVQTSLESAGKKLTDVWSGVPQPGASNGTGTGAGKEGEKEQVITIDVKSLEEWQKCPANLDKNSAEYKTCFDAKYSAWADGAKCYCLNQKHIDTGPPNNNIFFLTALKEPQGIYVNVAHGTRDDSFNQDHPYKLENTGEEKCDSEIKLCIKFHGFENPSDPKKAKISVRNMYTEPGTTLKIGETYYLKKGETYKIQTILGEHILKYQSDSAENAGLWVSQGNKPEDSLNCDGWFNSIWKPPIGEGSCCSSQYKICGKATRMPDDILKFQVCETARC